MLVLLVTYYFWSDASHTLLYINIRVYISRFRNVLVDDFINIGFNEVDCPVFYSPDFGRPLFKGPSWTVPCDDGPGLIVPILTVPCVMIPVFDTQSIPRNGHIPSGNKLPGQ